MSEIQVFYLLLAVFTLCYGVNYFINNEVLATIAAVAAIGTGVLALIVAF